MIVMLKARFHKAFSISVRYSWIDIIIDFLNEPVGQQKTYSFTYCVQTKAGHGTNVSRSGGVDYKSVMRQA